MPGRIERLRDRTERHAERETMKPTPSEEKTTREEVVDGPDHIRHDEEDRKASHRLRERDEFVLPPIRADRGCDRGDTSEEGGVLPVRSFRGLPEGGLQE